MPILINIVNGINETIYTGSIVSNRIVSVLKREDYINIGSFVAFLQNFSKATFVKELFLEGVDAYQSPDTGNHPTLTTIGVKNNLSQITLDISNQQTIYQDFKYIQLPHNCVRNSATNIFNTSSDFCSFTSPTFKLSGGTKIGSDIRDCDISGLNYSGMVLTAATYWLNHCSLDVSECYSGVTWNLEIYKNGINVYDNEFYRSIGLPPAVISDNILKASIISAFTALDYTYSFDGNIITLEKPSRSDNIQIDICIGALIQQNPVSPNPVSPSPSPPGYCDQFTGCCTEFCYNLCYFDFVNVDSGSTGVHIVTTATSISLDFEFTGNTSSFTNTTDFYFSIYKFNQASNEFIVPPIYTSTMVPYSAFSATNIYSTGVTVDSLGLDGEYLVKGLFVIDFCTEFYGRLGERLNTSKYITGNQYKYYNSDSDYYIIAVRGADKPEFINISNYTPVDSLVGISFSPQYSGQTAFTTSIIFQNDPLVALNGLTLARNYEYSFSGNQLTISAGTRTTDIITIVGVSLAGMPGILNEVIIISSPITSGVTDGQNGNLVYYNTTTGKYEVYSETTPQTSSDTILTLNGAVMAPNIDYYQSTSNNKRFILEGSLVVGDVINLYYNSSSDAVGDIYSNPINISWVIEHQPQLVNGVFTVEISTASTFSNISVSAATDYVVGGLSYTLPLAISGLTGTKLYCRVKNRKDFITLTEDDIASEAYSDTITLTIRNNKINSY